MGERRKRRGGSLCFAVVDLEDEAKARVSPAGRRHSRGRLLRRVLSKIFKSSASVAPLNRNEKSWKCLDSSDGKLADDDDAASIFSSSSGSASSLSSSSSSSSSCSSSSSRLSLAALAALPETAEPGALRKQAPPPRAAGSRKPPPGTARNSGAATGIFLLVASLSVTVFCGRLCAILWTTSWLFFVACRLPVLRLQRSSGGSEGGGGLTALRRMRLAEEKKPIVLEGLLERNRRV